MSFDDIAVQTPHKACWIFDVPLLIIPGEEMVVLLRLDTSLFYKDQVDYRFKKESFSYP